MKKLSRGIGTAAAFGLTALLISGCFGAGTQVVESDKPEVPSVAGITPEENIRVVQDTKVDEDTVGRLSNVPPQHKSDESTVTVIPIQSVEVDGEKEFTFAVQASVSDECSESGTSCPTFTVTSGGPMKEDGSEREWAGAEAIDIAAPNGAVMVKSYAPTDAVDASLVIEDGAKTTAIDAVFGTVLYSYTHSS